MRTKLVRDRLMEKSLLSTSKLNFCLMANAGLVESYMLLMQTKLNNILRIQKSFQRSFVTL